MEDIGNPNYVGKIETKNKWQMFYQDKDLFVIGKTNFSNKKLATVKFIITSNLNEIAYKYTGKSRMNKGHAVLSIEQETPPNSSPYCVETPMINFSKVDFQKNEEMIFEFWDPTKSTKGHSKLMGV